MTLDVSAHDLLNCRAGTTIKVPVTVMGRPVPKITWTFDGTAETEKKNELHTLPIDSEVRLSDQHGHGHVQSHFVVLAVCSCLHRCNPQTLPQ